MTLRELIQHRATTQAALARSLGWKPQTLSKYVSGARAAKLKTALDFAHALDAVLQVIPPPVDGQWQYTPKEEYEPTQPRTQERIIADLEGHNEEPDADRENGE